MTAGLHGEIIAFQSCLGHAVWEARKFLPDVLEVVLGEFLYWWRMHGWPTPDIPFELTMRVWPETFLDIPTGDYNVSVKARELGGIAEGGTG